jgi:hypothetical protein
MDEREKDNRTMDLSDSGEKPPPEAPDIQLESDDEVHQRDALYVSFGKFVIEFERLCFGMASCVMRLLESQGLQNIAVSKLLVADLTANPLRDLFRSLVSEILKPNKDEEEILKNIFDRIQKAIKTRNMIVHGTCFLADWNNELEDYSLARGFKWSKNKRGFIHKSFEYSANDIDRHTIELRYLQRLTDFLNISAQTGEVITDMIARDDDGKAHIPDLPPFH